MSCRYAADMREHMAWGALFRHTMQDPLMIEGAVHHLDLVADLAGAPCRTLYATTWKPDWARLCRRHRRHRDDDLRERRARRLRGQLDHRRRPQRLDREYVRVDCELGTAILNSREIEVFTRHDLARQRSREGQGQKIPLLAQPKWLNTWLIEQFCQWLDGGPEMETNVDANVQASALVFAAIESA